MTAKKKGSAIQSDQALQKVEYVHFNKRLGKRSFGHTQKKKA